MKYLLFIFLLLINFSWSNEKKLENQEAHILRGFQKFQVITLLPFFEKIDRKIIYDTMAESFKKYGQVVISEKTSMFQNLLQLDAHDPICFFVIDKDKEQIKGSLEILVEVEVLANQHKTICSIWKKNLSSTISSEMKNFTVENLIHEMIDDVSQDLIKANADSKQLIFHINKFQDL
jgi:hypothetical protein